MVLVWGEAQCVYRKFQVPDMEKVGCPLPLLSQRGRGAGFGGRRKKERNRV